MSESNLNKDYVLKKEIAAEFLREISEAIEESDQVNIELGDEKVIQPVDGEVPLRVYQDENGTEIGFRLNNDD